jgi:hypothetical protein
MRNYCFQWGLCGGSVLVVVAASIYLARVHDSAHPLVRLNLADGRILNVEGVTFGTKHVIGSRSLLVDNFGRCLPVKVRDWLTPKQPRSHIDVDTPSLVVWVNAVDRMTGRTVDCQGIRAEFVGETGDIFGVESTPYFGFGSFSRVGYVFRAFPRTERKLTLRVTPWKMDNSTFARIPNPHVSHRVDWVGNPLPQRQHVGDLDAVLSNLSIRTNGGPDKYWESPSLYWEPEWELRQNGQLATGWVFPEWSAQDTSGNDGRYLGLHEPVLRFSASFYPNATNEISAVFVTNSPAVSITNLESNVWWKLKARFQSKRLELLGLFPAGMDAFLEGTYQTNPPPNMNPVKGGFPSGWVGTTLRLTPFRLQEWDGHYAATPVVYLQADDLDANQRWGIRLRDEHGRLWAATPEPQGVRKGIRPFLVDLPPDVQTVVVEVVMLRPIKAAFYVDIKQASKP